MYANLKWNIPDSENFVGREADELRPGRHEPDGQNDAQVAFEYTVGLFADVRIEEVDHSALVSCGYQIHFLIVVESVDSTVGYVEVGSFQQQKTEKISVHGQGESC